MPLIVIFIGLIVAAAFHQLLVAFSRPNTETYEEVGVDHRLTGTEKENGHVVNEAREIRVNFSILQGIKLGFGIGIGILLFFILLWIIGSFVFISSIMALLGATPFR